MAITLRNDSIRFATNAGFRATNDYVDRRHIVADLAQQLLGALGPVIGRVNDVNVNVQEGNRLTLTNNVTQAQIYNLVPQDPDILHLCGRILEVANSCYERAPDAREPALPLDGRARPVPAEDGLNDQIRELQNELNELDQQHRELQRQYQDQVNTLDQQDRELQDQYQRHVGGLEAEHANLQAQHNELNQQHGQLQERYQDHVGELENEIARLTEENKRFQNSLGELRAAAAEKLAQARHATEADKIQIKALEDTLQNLDAKNTKARAELEQMSKLLSSNEHIIEDLARTNQQLTLAGNEQVARYETLLKEIQGLNADYQEATGTTQTVIKDNNALRNTVAGMSELQGQLDTLKAQNKEQREIITAREETLIELHEKNEKNQKSEALAKHFKGKMEQAMADREEVERQLLALKNKEPELEAAISELRSEISKKTSEISSLQADKDTAVAGIQKLASLFNSQNQVMKDLENRLSETNNRIAQATEKLGSVQKAKGALEHQVAHANQEKEELAQKVEAEKQDLNAKLTESTSEREALLKQIDELTQQHTQDQKLLFQANTELNLLKGEIDSLRALHNNLPQFDQNGAEQAPSENIGILASAEAFLNEDAEERLDLTDNAAALQSKLDQLADQYKDALAGIHDLEERLERTEQEKDALQQKVTAAEKRADDAEKRVEALTKQLEQMKLELASYKTANNDNSELKRQVAALIAERQNLTTALTLAQQHASQLQEKLTSAETTVSATNKQLIEANQKNKDLTSELNRLRTENSRLTEEIERLTKDLESVKAFALEQATTMEQLERELRKEKRDAEAAAENHKMRLDDMRSGFEKELASAARGHALLAKQLKEVQAQADEDRVKADAQMQRLVTQYETAHKLSEANKARLVELQEKYKQDLATAQQKLQETEAQRDEIASKARAEIELLNKTVQEFKKQAKLDREFLEGLTTQLNEARYAAKATAESHAKRVASLEERLKKAEEDLKAQEYQHGQVLETMRKNLDKALEENRTLRAEITKTKSVVPKAMQDTADAQATRDKNIALEHRVTDLKSQIVSVKVDAALSQTAREKAQKELVEYRKQTAVQIADLSLRNGALLSKNRDLEEALKKGLLAEHEDHMKALNQLSKDVTTRSQSSQALNANKAPDSSGANANGSAKKA